MPSLMMTGPWSWKDLRDIRIQDVTFTVYLVSFQVRGEDGLSVGGSFRVGQSWCFPVEVLRTCPAEGRPWDGARTQRRDYISHQARERLGIPRETPEDTAGQRDYLT